MVYYYYDRNAHHWEKGTWSKTIRNAARRGAAESLMEERLQQGANEWWKRLFEKCDTVGEEDWRECDRSGKFVSPEKWEKVTSGQWIQKSVWNRTCSGDDGGTGLVSQNTGYHHMDSRFYDERRRGS